jgi:hypothetical protein
MSDKVDDGGPAFPALRVRVARSDADVDWCERREDESSHSFAWLMPDPPTDREEDGYEDLPVCKVFGRLDARNKGKKWASQERADRAAYLERAVNSHAELVAALENLTERMQVDPGMGGPRFKGFWRHEKGGRSIEQDYVAATDILARAKVQP